MKYVSIDSSLGSDHRNSISLFDLLVELKEIVESLSWKVSGLECLGEGANELYKIEEAGESFDGTKLVRLARSITQMIDGKFEGLAVRDSRRVLIVQVVDGTTIDIASDDEDVLSRIKHRFGHVVHEGVWDKF